MISTRQLRNSSEVHHMAVWLVGLGCELSMWQTLLYAAKAAGIQFCETAHISHQQAPKLNFGHRVTFANSVSCYFRTIQHWRLMWHWMCYNWYLWHIWHLGPDLGSGNEFQEFLDPRNIPWFGNSPQNLDSYQICSVIFRLFGFLGQAGDGMGKLKILL